MYKNLLSIIIPTRNRQKYAELCVRTILSLDAEDYEVIIQDNSDKDTLRGKLADIVSNKLVYHYSPECLSFCSNFEKALEQASGDYFIFIGDDDAVLPQLFDVVKIARQHKIEAIRFSEYVSYKWPKATGGSENGTLVIRDVVPYVKYLDTSDAIAKMIQKGDFDYQQYHFPFVYHGVVRRSSFDRAKARSGHYFGGLTPDIYAAVSLSFQINKVLYINYPLTIPGICPKSGAADGLTGRHNGELKNAPHFRGTHQYAWDRRIPYVYSVDTIWAETALKAMEENGFTPRFDRRCFYRYTVKLCVKNPASKYRYIAFYKKTYADSSRLLRMRFSLSIWFYKQTDFFVRGAIFLKRILVGRHVFHHVENIKKATVITRKHLKKKGTYQTVKKQLGLLLKRK